MGSIEWNSDQKLRVFSHRSKYQGRQESQGGYTVWRSHGLWGIRTWHLPSRSVKPCCFEFRESNGLICRSIKNICIIISYSNCPVNRSSVITRLVRSGSLIEFVHQSIERLWSLHSRPASLEHIARDLPRDLQSLCGRDMGTLEVAGEGSVEYMRTVRVVRYTITPQKRCKVKDDKCYA
jgi:hypothetical protein